MIDIVGCANLVHNPPDLALRKVYTSSVRYCIGILVFKGGQSTLRKILESATMHSSSPGATRSTSGPPGQSISQVVTATVRTSKDRSHELLEFAFS